MPRMPVETRPAPARPEPRIRAESSDVEVLDQVMSGQPERFALIVRRYNGELYRIGMAYLRNHAQAEDAMQNAYLKAFVSLGQFHRTAAFATWLTRIMINECLMVLRRQMRVSLESIDSRATLQTESTEPSIIDLIHAREIQALLDHSLRELPPLHRTVYLLREMQQLSTAETAECLQLSPENVKVCLHRARLGLRAGLLKKIERTELLGYPATYCDPMTANVMQAVLALDHRT